MITTEHQLIAKTYLHLIGNSLEDSMLVNDLLELIFIHEAIAQLEE